MITRIAHKYLDYRYKEIDSFINKPIETQEKILEYLLLYLNYSMKLTMQIFIALISLIKEVGYRTGINKLFTLGR